MVRVKSEEKISSSDGEEVLPLNIYQRIMALSWMDSGMAELAADKIVSHHIESIISGEESQIWKKLAEKKFDDSNMAESEKSLLNLWSQQLSLDYEEAKEDDLKNEMRYLLARLDQEKNEKIKDKYSKLIREAQELGDKKKLKELLQEFSRLLKP